MSVAVGGGGGGSKKRASKTREPTEKEIDECSYSMNMSQLKDRTNGVFELMPKHVIINGKQIARTALRKRDLCRLYLSVGGEIKPKQHPKLKHHTPSQKPSVEQRRYERLLHQRSLDHHGTNKSSLGHERNPNVIAKDKAHNIIQHQKKSTSKPSLTRKQSKHNEGFSALYQKLNRLQLNTNKNNNSGLAWKHHAGEEEEDEQKSQKKVRFEDSDDAANKTLHHQDVIEDEDDNEEEEEEEDNEDEEEDTTTTADDSE